MRRNVLVLVLLSFSVVTFSEACGNAPREDLTGTKPYSDPAGAEYTVIANDSNAYGPTATGPTRP